MDPMHLTVGKSAALAGIVLTAVLFVTISAFDFSLGLPIALAGVTTALGVPVLSRRSPFALVREIPWGVLPLVAGLFVLAEAIDSTGLIGEIAQVLT